MFGSLLDMTSDATGAAQVRGGSGCTRCIRFFILGMAKTDKKVA